MEDYTLFQNNFQVIDSLPFYCDVVISGHFYQADDKCHSAMVCLIELSLQMVSKLLVLMSFDLKKIPCIFTTVAFNQLSK